MNLGLMEMIAVKGIERGLVEGWIPSSDYLSILLASKGTSFVSYISPKPTRSAMLIILSL